ncbi:MAG: hypothetical protein ACFFC7_16345 [Candidatus Hermodarchaeota archaeon]
MEKKKKIQVEVFVPAGVCGCVFSHWIDRVWKVLMKYRDEIDCVSSTSDSLRAQELEISQGIVVNNQKVKLSDLDRTIQKILST